LLLEFGLLSYLTKDPVYEKVARTISEEIYFKRNPNTGLVGNELNVRTGAWQGLMSGLGAGIDSYLEYLLKVRFTLHTHLVKKNCIIIHSYKLLHTYFV
jgi:mannosidase alpha-like ER degradation enhancer 1